MINRQAKGISELNNYIDLLTLDQTETLPQFGNENLRLIMHEEYNLEDDQTAMVKEYVNDLIKNSIRELTGDTEESLQYLEP